MRSYTFVKKLAIAVALAVIASCAPPGSVQSDRGDQEQQIEDVSSVAPSADTLQQEDLRVTIQRLPRIESEGDCAPRYKNGMLGACIAGKECRGFGVRDKNGKALCSCYGLIGGCGEGLRCDDEKLTCVPEGELPGDPAEAD